MGPSSAREPRTPAQVVARAAADALHTAAHTAAGELSTGRRRLVRVGAAAGYLAFVSVGGVAATTGRARGPALADRPDDAPTTAHKLVDGVSAGHSIGFLLARRFVLVVGLGVGVPIARHELGRRWLDRLRRAGHPRPHAALALRLGAVVFALDLVGHVAMTSERRQLAAAFGSR